MNNYPKPERFVDDEWIQKTILEKLKSRLSDSSSQGLKIGELLKDPDLIRNINYLPAYEGVVRSNVRYLVEQGFVQCDEPLEDIQGFFHTPRKLPLSAEIKITDEGIDYLKFVNIRAREKKDEDTPRQVLLEKPLMISSSLIGMLRELKGKFCLFIGAGASTSAGIPCGRDFQTKILYRLYGKSLNDTAIEEEFRREFKDKIGSQKLTLEMIFQGLKEKFGGSAFDILQKGFDGSLELPSGYYSLAYLIQHGFFKIVFTVNLDELIEKSLSEEIGSTGYNLICETDRFKSLTPTPTNYLAKPLLVKLHGTYTLKSTLIVSWEDVQKLPPEKTEFLEYYASNYPMLFVGYSGRDPDIKRVLRKASNNSNDKTFCVSPNELGEDAKELLGFYNSSSNHIRMTSDDFFDELEHRLIGGYPRLKNEVGLAILDSGAVDSEIAMSSEQIRQKILQHPSWGYKISKCYKGRENRLKRDIEASLQSLIEKRHVEYEGKGLERRYWD